MNSRDTGIMQLLTSQPVLNMLNAKYIIYNKDAAPFPNTGAMGNAWFVPAYRVVPNSDSEIVAVGRINPAAEMLIDRRYAEQVKGYAFKADSNASIRMTSYRPNHLQYGYSAAAPRLTVFSEIYYDKGWNAYVDGKPAPYFRTNYVLRGMLLPSGSHTVEFRFEPAVVATGERIALASSATLLLLAALMIFLDRRKAVTVS
jgi:hypothetical protein